MRTRGFTLIELVIVIAVGAVVVSFAAMFISSPVRAYADQARRSQLVDSADSALRFMARDLRAALPNSVRVTTSGSVAALELLATLDGARYRDAASGTPSADLDFTQADGAFSTTTPFSEITLPFDSTTSYLVIDNIGVTGANAYDMSNVITPVGTHITITAGSSGSSNVTLAPTFKFSWTSPGKRVYLVSGPVTYLCDVTLGTLTRYAGYAIGASQPSSAATLVAAGATVSAVASNVGSCIFDYTPGVPGRAGLVTLDLGLTASGESVTLLHQVHLPNGA